VLTAWATRHLPDLAAGHSIKELEVHGVSSDAHGLIEGVRNLTKKTTSLSP